MMSASLTALSLSVTPDLVRGPSLRPYGQRDEARWILKRVQDDGGGTELHSQIIALSARSLNFWQRSILAAWLITPALHSAKLTSATGSTQNIVLPAP